MFCHTDYTAAAFYKGHSDGNQHSTWFFTPPVAMPKRACLTLDLFQLGSLHIKLCSDEDMTQRTCQTVYTSSTYLGLDWHQLILDIKPFETNEQTYFAFEAISPPDCANYFVTIDNLLVYEGRCIPDSKL